MNLYHISQTACSGYDTFSDAVVAAETEGQAKMIHPASSWNEDGEIRHLKNIGPKPVNDDEDDDWWFSSWPEDPSFITATLIGTAVEGTPESVICASFHAG